MTSFYEKKGDVPVRHSIGHHCTVCIINISSSYVKCMHTYLTHYIFVEAAINCPKEFFVSRGNYKMLFRYAMISFVSVLTLVSDNFIFQTLFICHVRMVRIH